MGSKSRENGFAYLKKRERGRVFNGREGEWLESKNREKVHTF